MRDPSLHIKSSDLREVLELYFPNLNESNLNDLVSDLLLRSKKYTCNNRSMLVKNKKQRKAMTTILQSSKSDADLIARIIQMVRVKLGHNGVRKIRENGREWPQVKELANTCNQYCEVFSLPKKEGYTKYIEMGMKKIKSMYGYLVKLNNMYESLVQQTQALREFGELVDSNAADEMHDIYVEQIASRTGIQESYRENPTKMVSFAKACDQAASMGCDIKTWIMAQFEALSFCNGIPTPEQLYGDTARERLIKFCYQNNIKLGETQKRISGDDWRAILNESEESEG